MKKKYEKPEVYSEDVGVAFVQDNCEDILAGPNAGYLDWCLDPNNCGPGQVVPYRK